MIRHVGIRVAAAVAATGAVALAGPSAVASSGSNAQWDFSEVSAASAIPPGTSFGTPALYAAKNGTSLVSVSAAGRRALDVSAWRALAPHHSVARTRSMLSTDANFARGTPWGTDAGSSRFDPGSGDLRVSVWIRPTDAAQFPRGTTSVRRISPNIVQKGRSSSSGGFWKVHLRMVSTGSGYAWAPGCVLKSGDGKTAGVNQGGRAFVLRPGVGTEIRCERVGNRLALFALGDDGSRHSTSVSIPAELRVANSAAVSVGNKPGSTDPRDAYDGLLTDLRISVG